MNYRELLSSPLYRNSFEIALQDVKTSIDTFNEVYNLMFDKNEKMAARAAWLCEKVSEQLPGYFSEQALPQIMELSIKASYNGLQRLTLTILLNLGLPDEVSVDFINVCFERMISPKYPTAVQVLSMKILYELTKSEPDFRSELQSYLDTIEIENYSVGYQTARRNIMKKLNA